MGSRRQAGMVRYNPTRTRVLNEHAEGLVDRNIRVVEVLNNDLEAGWLGSGSHDCNHLRVTVPIYVEASPRCSVEPVTHRHRFSGGGRLIEQRSVRYLEAREI